jgi:hypothetical protein
MSQIKIASIGNGLYQYDDQNTPLERESLVHWLVSVAGFAEDAANEYVDDMGEDGISYPEIPEGKDVGTVVDVYEVVYNKSTDPTQATEELAYNLDEQEDFVTQYLFPEVPVDEVSVGKKREPAVDIPEKESSTWRSVLKCS